MDYKMTDGLREGMLLDESVIIGKAQGQEPVYEAFDRDLNIHGVIEGVITSDSECRDSFRKSIQNENSQEKGNSGRIIYRMIENEIGIFVFASRAGNSKSADKTSDLAHDLTDDKIRRKKDRRKSIIAIAGTTTIVLIAGMCLVKAGVIKLDALYKSTAKGDTYWESNKGANSTFIGKYQKDAGYFEKNGMNFIDIYLKERGASDIEFGAKYDSMCELKTYLDEIGIDYAVGEKEDIEDETRGIVVRIASDNIGADFPDMLFGDDFGLGCLYLKNDTPDGPYWDAESKIDVNKLTKDPDAFISDDKVIIKTGEIQGASDGCEIAWCVDNYNGTRYYPLYLFGTYNDGTVFLDACNADKDILMSDFADIYIRLIKAKLTVRKWTLSDNYSLNYKNEDEVFFGIHSLLLDEILESSSDFVSRETGLDAAIHMYTGGVCSISCKSNNPEKLTEEYLRILASFWKCIRASGEIKNLGVMSALSINQHSDEEGEIVTTTISFSAKEIWQYRFYESDSGNESNNYENQSDEIIRYLENDDRFAGYTVAN